MVLPNDVQTDNIQRRQAQKQEQELKMVGTHLIWNHITLQAQSRDQGHQPDEDFQGEQDW